MALDRRRWSAPIIAQTLQHRIPAIYVRREFASSRWTQELWNDVGCTFEQVGIYTGQFPKELNWPTCQLLQTAEFEFLINLKTSKEKLIQISGPNGKTLDPPSNTNAGHYCD
jgi:hypothetical protein